MLSHTLFHVYYYLEKAIDGKYDIYIAAINFSDAFNQAYKIRQDWKIKKDRECEILKIERFDVVSSEHFKRIEETKQAITQYNK